MTDHDSFAERGRALEEEYFRKRDRELIEKMRQAASAAEARAGLGEKTGIQDPAILDELSGLGFTPDTVILLPLVPLLEVAWAEGGITAAERELIVSLARQRGVEKDSAADRQLNQWMATRPSTEMFTRATRLISAILGSNSTQATGGLSADDLVAHCEKIAAASGGIFGMRLRSISPDEKSLLSRIASELKAR